MILTNKEIRIDKNKMLNLSFTKNNNIFSINYNILTNYNNIFSTNNNSFQTIINYYPRPLLTNKRSRISVPKLHFTNHIYTIRHIVFQAVQQFLLYAVYGDVHGGSVGHKRTVVLPLGWPRLLHYVILQCYVIISYYVISIQIIMRINYIVHYNYI